MKLAQQVVKSAAGQGILKLWANVSGQFFEKVQSTYPYLVEANIRSLGEATADLLARGDTDSKNFADSQYPNLPLDALADPVFKALYEVGAINLHRSGSVIVEPTPASLFQGLARLALRPRYLFGIVNSVRVSRGMPILTEVEFCSLNRDYFDAVRRGISLTLGDHWYAILHRSASLMHGAVVLPCLSLRRSQEFYEEGIKFYRNQGESEVFIFSTTSGLIIPQEFRGDAAKNTYRYNYFTKGLLGNTQCIRIYQWERYRTSKALATGYNKLTDRASRQQYLEEAYETLRHFANANRLAIYEVDHFSSWKEWHTLSGPRRQQLSIRSEHGRGAIGHGVLYDAAAFRARSDLLKGASAAASLAVVASGKSDILEDYGPAFAVAAAACSILGYGTQFLPKLIQEPVLKKCKAETSNPEVRPIKRLGKSISHSSIMHIVDHLLYDGLKLLSSDDRTAVPDPTREKR